MVLWMSFPGGCVTHRTILLTAGVLAFSATVSAQATYVLKPTPKTVSWYQCDAEFWAKFPGMPRNQLRERVGPAQAGETSEISVGGVEDAAVLDGECGQVGVTDQRAASLAIQQHLPEQAPVLISGWQETHVGLLQPLIHNLDGFFWREPLSGKSWIRDDSEEGCDRLPW
jgi:hypothetical protein